jgi:hypothetical protein
MDTPYETSTDLPRDMDVDNSGYIYVVGSRGKENQTSRDGFVIKVRGSDGTRVSEDLEWEQVTTDSISVDNNANVYVVGSSFSYPQWRLVVAKYPAGRVRSDSREWTQELLVPGYVSCYGKDVQVTPDGTEVYVLGSAVSSTGNSDILLVKYSPDGTLSWWVI